MIKLFKNNGELNVAQIYPLSINQLIDQEITVEEIGTKIRGKSNDLWEEQVAKWAEKWGGTKDKINQKKREKSKNGKSAYFPKFYDSLKMDRLVLLANNIREASINKKFTDSTDVIEILVTTTNQEKDKAGISETFCHKLAQENEVSGIYKHILIPLCMNRRNEEFGENEKKINQTDEKVIQRLNEIVKNPHKFKELTENDLLVNALVTFSYPKLRYIFKKYEEKYKSKIEVEVDDVYIKQFKHLTKKRITDALKLNLHVEQHFWQTLDAIITDIQYGRPYFFAQLLKEKLDKLRGNEKWASSDALKDVTRILLTRAPIDLADIDQEFQGLNGSINITISISAYIEQIIGFEKEKKQKENIHHSFSIRSKSHEDIGTAVSSESNSAAANGKPSQKIETLKAFKEIVDWATEQRRLSLERKRNGNSGGL
ncbi:hypothetical protein niasHS_009801 [Heterodera schachtii]|uniref:Uncharacterized protein n=1 Tax=Heterodera schachtii TaxID=97005 RepID=A0ABD2JAT6_HETSC